MSSPHPAGARPQRRPRLRIEWILLALLATVLVAGILIQRGSPSTTILVTDLQPGVDVHEQIKGIQEKPRQEDVDLVLFVAKPEQRDLAVAGQNWAWPGGVDLQQLAQKAGQKPWLLVVSRQKAAEVRKALEPDARVAYLDGDEIKMESWGVRPGLLPWATWAWVLALLVIGAVFGRILLPRARPAGPPDIPRPKPAPPARGQADFDWPPADAGAISRRGEIDLRPFHKRSTVDSWVPQCPYCAAFDVQAWDRDGRSHYRCGWCAEEWQVRAGEPWPTVVARPRRGRAD
jgi:hypothetical protein